MKKTKMLKKNYEFKRVLSKGKCYYGEFIIAFIVKNNCRMIESGKNCNFLGLAISTKVCKAVGRNRIKRLIREAYYLQEKNIYLGYSIVVLWNKKADPKCVDFFGIKEDINNILKKAKLI